MPFTGKQLDGIWNTHTKGKYTAIKKMNRSSVKWLGGISTRWKKCSVVKHIRTKQTNKKNPRVCRGCVCIHLGYVRRAGRGWFIHMGHVGVCLCWAGVGDTRAVWSCNTGMSSAENVPSFILALLLALRAKVDILSSDSMIDSIIFLPRSIFLISIWIQRDGFLFSQSNSLHFYFGTCHAGILYSFPRFLFGFKLGMAHMVF